MGNAACAVAMADGQRQSVFALWRTSAFDEVQKLYDGGMRALWRLQEALGAKEAVYVHDAEASFQSLNRPEDLASLATAVARAKR
jgi:molybdopterin-guanine dinucleotide biosynthesis protein A